MAPRNLSTVEVSVVRAVYKLHKEDCKDWRFISDLFGSSNKRGKQLLKRYYGLTERKEEK